MKKIRPRNDLRCKRDRAKRRRILGVGGLTLESELRKVSYIDIRYYIDDMHVGCTWEKRSNANRFETVQKVRECMEMCPMRKIY